jgi:hypothetical protein
MMMMMMCTGKVCMECPAENRCQDDGETCKYQQDPEPHDHVTATSTGGSSGSYLLGAKSFREYSGLMEGDHAWV